MVARKALFILTTLFVCTANTDELYESARNVRALGMGNAFTAVANDDWSLNYNPAGLSQVKGYHVSLLSLNLGLNGTQAIETIENISSATGSVGDQLASITGDRLWIAYNANMAFYMKNFGLNYFYDGYIDPYVTNPAFTSLNISYYLDQGYGMGFAFGGKDVSLGFSFRRITRTGGYIPIGVDSLQSVTFDEISDQINSTGVGYGLDVGVLWKFGSESPMRLGAVYKNLGNTTFQATGSSSSAPTGIDAEVAVGWAMDIDAPGIAITPAFDYKHILKTSEPLAKKIHFGVEVDLPIITVRGGFSQGYYTYGLGIGLGPLDIELATYGVELGAYAGQVEDRRYMLEISSELGFDVDLSFSDFGSTNRRKLKQRR